MRKEFEFFARHKVLITGVTITFFVAVILIVISGTRFREARDARRITDIQKVTNALHQYVIDHQGALPPGIDGTQRQIGTATSDCALSTPYCSIQGDHDCIDLSEVLDPYLRDIPSDPGRGNNRRTHYSVRVDRNKALVVEACDFTR